MVMYILLGALILVLFILSMRITEMTNAANRLNASIGDLEATVSDGVTALQNAAQPGTDDATLNGFADRVDAANKQLTDALAQKPA